MSDSRTFVILGASQAGGWIARTLRTEGFEGRIPVFRLLQDEALMFAETSGPS